MMKKASHGKAAVKKAVMKKLGYGFGMISGGTFGSAHPLAPVKESLKVLLPYAGAVARQKVLPKLKSAVKSLRLLKKKS